MEDWPKARFVTKDGRVADMRILGRPLCACGCGEEVQPPARKWVAGHTKVNPGPVSDQWAVIARPGSALAAVSPKDYVPIRTKHAFWIGIAGMFGALRYDGDEAKALERASSHLYVWASRSMDAKDTHTKVRRDHLALATLAFTSSAEDEETSEELRIARMTAFNAAVNRMARPVT